MKPIELMRWLVRLVTPPDGVVLDPFCGSGSTGAAAVLERVNFVGIEREDEYVRIARARVAWWEQHPDGLELTAALSADRERRRVADSGQASLFEAPATNPAPPPNLDREGEASAERRYTDRGGTNFAPKPGRRRHD